jgi:hypothetical protein
LSTHHQSRREQKWRCPRRRRSDRAEDDALREGPIPGVEEVVGEEAFERLCIAGSRQAVREAARRATIENLPVLLGEEAARFVWIAPLGDERPRLMVEARTEPTP